MFPSQDTQQILPRLIQRLPIIIALCFQTLSSLPAPFPLMPPQSHNVFRSINHNAFSLSTSDALKAGRPQQWGPTVVEDQLHC